MLMTVFGSVAPARLVLSLNASSAMPVTARPLIVSGMATAPPGPVYPVIVMVLSLVM